MSSVTSSTTVVPQDPSASFVKLPVSTELVLPALSTPLLATSSTSLMLLATSTAAVTSLSDIATRSISSGTNSRQPEETGAVVASHHTQTRISTAVIVSAIIGGIILLFLAICLVLCLKRQKNKSVYQAPIYVSSFNTSRDMTTPSPTSKEMKFRTRFEGVQELDGRGVRNELAQQALAELHGESLTHI